MVFDFADIKEVWKAAIEPLVDHRSLNETLVLDQGLPVSTAEWIAWWICKVFREQSVPVVSVEVWETSTSSAKVNVYEVWSYEERNYPKTKSTPVSNN